MSDVNAPTPPDPNDPLALTELFKGGGEPWLPLLKPVIEAQPPRPRSSARAAARWSCPSGS